MASIIKSQNRDILKAWWKYTGRVVTDNVQLARALNIELPPVDYAQDYVMSDVRVMVI
jgi:hypothetical protein